MATLKKVDVVTIGAGWTSAIMGWKLGKAGHRVVAIEQGPMRWANPDFEHNHDGLEYHVRHKMMVDLAKETWTWRPNPNAPTLPLRRFNPGPFNPGSGLGGSAVHWTAQLFRFFHSDFNYRSHHIERYGESKLPIGNRIRDWPITYDELEPYYTQFDYDIGASGQVGNLNGQIIEGGDPFTGPFSRPYPNPPLAVVTASDLFAQATKEMGYHPFPHPTGILSQGWTDPFGNDRSGCIYCGHCTRFGCEVDAKSSAQTTHLPEAFKTGKYEVRPNSKVLRINIGSDGLATGVTYIDANGQEQEQPADVVMLTAYTLTNVRMMLLSRGGKHPNGIGNDQGLVGKNFTYQLFKTPVHNIFDGRKFNLFMGNGITRYLINDLGGDNFDHKDLNFIGGAAVFGPTGEVDPDDSTSSFPYDGGPKSPRNNKPIAFGAKLKDALRKNWDGDAGILIQGESLPYEDQFFDLDPVYKDAYGAPLLRLTFDFHENDHRLYEYIAEKCKEIGMRMGPTSQDVTSSLSPFEIRSYQTTHVTGGAIMGTDAGNSVTSKYGQVWDTPNVFVTGAAMYPQNPCLNPTGTLCPLAYMAGDAIRDRYFKNPGKMLE